MSNHKLGEYMFCVLGALLKHQHEIEKALLYTRGTHTFDDIVQMVLDRKLLCWLMPNGVLLTEEQQYPRTANLHVFLAGGSLKELLDIHPQVMYYARNRGYSNISINGRRGWSKALAPMGWEETNVVLNLTVGQEKYDWEDDQPYQATAQDCAVDDDEE